MRQLVIPELFFKKIAERGKLHSRIWIYWLGNFIDEIFDNEFLKKQEIPASISRQEITEIYEFGMQLLRQDFRIIENKKTELKIPKYQKEIAETAIDYLNEKANKKFSKKTLNIKLIVTLLNEGYSLEDFKYVVDKKCHDWLGTNYQEYLRPSTLFGNRFENYINTKNDKPGPTSFEQFALSVAQAQSISFRRNK